MMHAVDEINAACPGGPNMMRVRAVSPLEECDAKSYGPR